MIARLCGRLVEKQPNRVIVDVQGVGYDVQVPLSTFYGLGEPGGDVVFRVHTHVREDTLALFGFATLLELKLFEQLIGITGIGPRLALAVLSGIESADLVRAVRQGDVVRLTGIPGVGKKTAERIGLELKDRLPATLDLERDGPDIDVGETDMRGDLLSALLNLGYHRPLAERAVDAALAAGDGAFEQTLRRALKELAR
ncbi:MAG: Holliday junction branch migration protein RuvA [Acidobacteria bacterium]|jgi:Holliday junction DNA helicase RuvA|nr:Holliday junction branch migration protein RuvA [Acidobacteriota bacterium]MDP7479129.1 Holliday junction branch migration protein RuvA [Vicinamibacterales bacterium]MDP7691196.1 Holliday junction branch migration protein RuvA [Vicinamibacterales bacterium]HJN45635.1 Holliday junction branch migration protein RuvA [Vicinamibacterales bacterium]|tara:strand:+ start:1923 stop:2519 length:597 start_codon:yes stop_codon:yes gene_type:complete